MNGEVFLFTRKLGRQIDAKILEIGSMDVNGSVRENFSPAEYVGIDVRPGPAVDIVMPAEDLPSRFPAGYFDAVLCCETLEHCENWQEVLSAGWHVLKVGGKMCVTTPSKKKGYHGYPHDYWRFTIDDYRVIFRKQTITAEHDVGSRGIGVIVKKLDDRLEFDIEPYRVEVPAKFR